MDDTSIFITGANGQLGSALRQKYPKAKSADINELDITDQKSVENFDWSNVKYILNAAAYTNVDGAETAEGRIAAWKVNAVAVGYLAKIAREKDIKILHISTDYVFDGRQNPHTESENFSPLSVYGSSKAAGDLLVSQNSKYYILRTSWVIGEGKNFVRTMLELGKNGVNPSVVSDQIGRLTFTNELVEAIDFVLLKNIEFGTYNLSNEGQPASWADITREIFKQADYNNTVTDITTEEYYKGKSGIAPRPLNSILDLSKLRSLGYSPSTWQDNLKEYINKELA